MDRHVLIVMSNPVAGKEAEYNDWYDNTHLKEVVAIPGFVGAERYQLADVPPMPGAPEPSHRYLAIYDVEGDAAAAMENLMGASGGLNMSDAIDLTTVQVTLFTSRQVRVGADRP